MFTCVEVKTKKDKDLFLSLPKKLYDKKFLTQDLELEKKILNCVHPLSIDFDIYPFILLNTSGKIVSRCVLTVYPNDYNGYVIESRVIELINSIIGDNGGDNGGDNPFDGSFDDGSKPGIETNPEIVDENPIISNAKKKAKKAIKKEIDSVSEGKTTIIDRDEFLQTLYDLIVNSPEEIAESDKIAEYNFAKLFSNFFKTNFF